MANTKGDRRFLWLRLIGLVLITAYGLWSASELDAADAALSGMDFRKHEHDLRNALLVTVPLFAWWSLAVLAMALVAREGRKTWRRPGIVPGMAVGLFIIRNIIESDVMMFRYKWHAPSPFWWAIELVTPTPHELQTISHSAGFAIAATWLALRAGGWWHCAPTWTDRAGRALGWYWIVVAVIDPFYFSLV